MAGNDQATTRLFSIGRIAPTAFKVPGRAHGGMFEAVICHKLSIAQEGIIVLQNFGKFGKWFNSQKVAM